MTPQLRCAFQATTYRVHTPEACFNLRIGITTPAFDTYLRRQNIVCWGIVSAYNPGASLCSEGENALRQQALQMRVQALGWTALSGVNIADAGDWPSEASSVLLGVDEAEVCALGRAFHQIAVVCGEVGSAPRLVSIEDEQQ